MEKIFEEIKDKNFPCLMESYKPTDSRSLINHENHDMKKCSYCCLRFNRSPKTVDASFTCQPICHELNYVPPKKKYIGVLTLSTYEYELTWK